MSSAFLDLSSLGSGVTLSATYIALGTAPYASAGDLRLSATGNIKARNAGDTADITMAVVAADVLSFGDSANTAGLVLNTKTATTIAAKVNGTAVGTFSSTGLALPGVISLGSTVAAAGDVRGAATLSIACRNAGGSADLNVASAAADVLTYGGTSNAGVVIGTATGNSIALQVNGAAVGTFNASGLTTTANLLVGATPRASAGHLRGPATLSIKCRNAGDSADLNVCTAAADVLTFGGTANAGVVIGTATGSVLSLQVNGSAVATVDANGVNSTVGARLGATASLAASGLLRFASAGGGSDTVLAAVRNNANGADVYVLQHIGSSDEIRLGSASGSTTNSVSCNTNATFTVRCGGSAKFTLTSAVCTIASPLALTGQTVGTTVGLGGAGSAPPATPEGYISVPINGTTYKIPYYLT